jgi:hypothetical protein
MLIDIVLVVVVLVAIWGFVSIVGLNTRWLSRRTDRTAESMYGAYGGSTRRHRLGVHGRKRR